MKKQPLRFLGIRQSYLIGGCLLIALLALPIGAFIDYKLSGGYTEYQVDYTEILSDEYIEYQLNNGEVATPIFLSYCLQIPNNVAATKSFVGEIASEDIKQRVFFQETGIEQFSYTVSKGCNGEYITIDKGQIETYVKNKS